MTPADIAAEFRDTAGPFLVIGEIEEHVRWLIERQLDPRVIEEVVGEPPVPGRAIRAANLTIDQMQRLLENPERWQRVGLAYDRQTFCREMDAIREFRNALMHFRDPLGPEELNRLRNLADMLRAACSELARTPRRQPASARAQSAPPAHE